MGNETKASEKQGLLKEVEIMQNPLLGAVAIHSFIKGFERSDGEGYPTFWHIYTILPLVLNAISQKAILIRQEGSGLRAILNGDRKHDLKQNEAIFALEYRMLHMRERTERALKVGLNLKLFQYRKGYFSITDNLDLKKMPLETRNIGKASDRLGFWSGNLTLYQYLNALGVKP